LSAVGINVNVLEVPSPDTQLLLLQSDDVREEIAAEVGVEVEVQFPINWEAPATFTCNQPVKEDCIRTIDAYIAKAMEIRRSAVVAGITDLRAVLADLQKTNPDPVVERQLAALSALENNLKLPIVLVDEFEQSIGGTVSDVRRPTLLIGVLVGLLISLLILLQLTYSDGRVRSVRQLVRLVGVDAFLGEATKRVHAIRDRRTALSLNRCLDLHPAAESRVRFIPLRQNLQHAQVTERITTMTGALSKVVKPFSELSVTELAGPTPDEVDVLVVQRNRDLRKDVVEAVVALSRSGRRFAGVLLVD
jgi:hypothetical protein